MWRLNLCPVRWQAASSSQDPQGSLCHCRLQSMSVLCFFCTLWLRLLCYIENFLNREYGFHFTWGETCLPAFALLSLPTQLYWTPAATICGSGLDAQDRASQRGTELVPVIMKLPILLAGGIGGISEGKEQRNTRSQKNWGHVRRMA